MEISPKAVEFAKEHHAFYEVQPSYVVIGEKAGSLPSNRSVHAGFDVDIYGVAPNNELRFPGSDYALGYAEVQKAAEEISRHTSEGCSLEVIPFPSSVVIGGTTHADVHGMLRIRILHYRGLDQPAGLPEEQALKKLENQLQKLGVARR